MRYKNPFMNILIRVIDSAVRRNESRGFWVVIKFKPSGDIEE